MLKKEPAVHPTNRINFQVTSFLSTCISFTQVTSKPGRKSAMCVYSLKAIRRKFMANIQGCFSGVGERGLSFISPSIRCIETKLKQIGEDFCGLDLNSPLGGEMPITNTPVLEFKNSQLSAVTATSTGDYTVAFLGTSDGRMKKVSLFGLHLYS